MGKSKQDDQSIAPAESPLQADENSPASFSADASPESAPPESAPPESAPAEVAKPPEDAPKHSHLHKFAFKVLSRLHHNGKHYNVDDTVMLTAHEALPIASIVQPVSDADQAAAPPAQ